MEYKQEYKNEISFPLGGIGTGSIGLGGNGGFRDIEIMNKPNKGTAAEFTHFIIKAENDREVVDCRVLQTDLQTGYIGSLERETYTGYGFGPDRGSMAGFPHFQTGEFQGQFPIAKLDFAHAKFPGTVEMEAFNPLIPTKEDDSSIPAAFFAIHISNTTEETLHYSLGLSCNNYYDTGLARHAFFTKDKGNYLRLSNGGEKDNTQYGDLTIATDCEEVSCQEYWFRGSWFDHVSVFWQDFNRYGRLKNRTYLEKTDEHRVFQGRDIGTLAAHVTIAPHESKTVRFVLSWSMPYMNNTWQITHLGLGEEEIQKRRNQKWKNYYATLFKDSVESAAYGLENFERLYGETKKYVDIMYRSSLPKEVLDAVTANVSILKSTTCLRLEDGSFYGFEGTHAHMGSCEGTCTHVWSYAYALAFLFPKLERSARSLEYTQSMQENGGMGFRLQLPVGVGPTNHRAAIDGQYGTVLRVWREYLISGDKEWLSSIWEAVKKSIAFAWSTENPDKWDADRDGIPEGRQHHTLDMELFGANAWLAGMYLAGLQAGMCLAGVMEDKEALAEYEGIFKSGVEKLNTELFNGEYYIQKVDLYDKKILEGYEGGTSEHSQDAVQSYWNEETGQMKYQIGEGCSIDQVLGQWHADILGLGDIFVPEQVESALRAIYRYNYVPVMREHVNPCRIYAVNDESGTIICSYPAGCKKPAIPVPYAEETMHGFEYQAAAHMILRGMEEEGLSCVRAIREKYNGKRRNPYNEMECGSNYARSMASYALLLAYSGFKCDMAQGKMCFCPLHKGNSRFFWSVDSGFGEIIYDRKKITLYVALGSLALHTLELSVDSITKVKQGEGELDFVWEEGLLRFTEKIILTAGMRLECTM